MSVTQVEIVIANGPDEFRSTADVLPHDPDAAEIPIRSARGRDNAPSPGD